MTQTAEPTLAEMQAQLEKIKRRKRRNEKAAFAKGMMQGVCSMLKPGDVALDCGANVGVVTKQLAASGAEVHAYEPDPFAFGQLKKVASEFPNVTLHHVAVGVEEGSVALLRASNFDDNPKGASVKSTVMSGGRGIDESKDSVTQVPQISLLDQIEYLTNQYGEIAFLKMDIEGAELEIIETMLERNLFDNIRLTVVETHERKFKALRPRFRAIRAAVTEAFPITKVNLDWI